MGIFDIFPRTKAEPIESQNVRAMAGEAGSFYSMDDPALLEFIRSGGAGGETAAGLSVSAKMAMRNTTVLRCVSLISFAIGMLPLHLQRRDDKTKAKDHALFRVLHRKPNGWQTAFEFRSFMQQLALEDGNAYALIIRSGTRVIGLVPLERGKVTVKQNADWSLSYWVDRGAQGVAKLEQRDVFHLRYGMSEDGFTGLSLVKQAAEAIALAIQTERASARLFKNGMIVGQTLKHPGKLSPEAFERLKESLTAREGAGNAYKSMILEEGMDLAAGSSTGRDAQALEQRRHQIEEIARPFGVPRPLLGVDETSWGSGIDVLGQFFVRYALNPWFEAWQQAIERSLLTDAEAEEYEAKFNAGALLRGSMSDQADFFAKALGAGGHSPWMSPDEVREIMDQSPRDDLPLALGRQNGDGNEPPQTSED